MPEGLAILLGKKPPEPKSSDKGKGGEPDEYDALARGMMRAFEKKDTDALATLLRDCGLFGHGTEDEDYE